MQRSKAQPGTTQPATPGFPEELFGVTLLLSQMALSCIQVPGCPNVGSA